MKRKMLFISDLDGTLLDDQKKIPDNVIEEINHFVQQGHLFTIATGRTEDTCRLATDKLPVNAPVVLYNGASIMDLKSGQVLHQRTLDAGLFKPIVQKLIDRFPDICIQIFAYGPLVLVNPNAPLDPYIIREKQPHCYKKLENTPDIWLKIMLSAPNTRLKEAATYLDNCTSLPSCSRFFSADYYYEIVAEGCSKGDCARWLSNWLGLHQCDVAAMGDHLNDEEILSWCGIPYAPSNAHECIRSIAHVTKKSNRDGAVAEALRSLQAKSLET